jgi:hypothetical protein
LVGPEIEQGLSQIIRDTPRLQEELGAHPGSKRIFNATAWVFAHVVCYLVNVKALLASPEWKRVLKSSFKNKLNQILASLDSANKTLDREIRSGQGARKSKPRPASLVASSNNGVS